MKKLLIFFIFLSSLTFGQNKYLIYFKDKGITKNQKILKESSLYQNAYKSLSKRSIDRRKKVLGDKVITYADLPININYINKIEESGIKIHNKLKWFNAVSAYLTQDQFNKIKSMNFVDKIETVKIFKKKKHENEFDLNKPQEINNNDYGNSFNQLNLSSIPLLHNNDITGKGIIIGVLDSGFDWKEHEALKNTNVIAEYDFIFKDSITANQKQDVFGQDSHGTYVLSIISGFMQGKLIGSAYDAEFILAKTENIASETHTEEDNYAAALEWMESLGVDITSSSLGYSEFDNTTFSYTYEDMDGKSTIVTKAAELAFERGVLTVTSAGNEGNSSWKYITAPADGFNTLAVGAVSSSGNIASFSSRGPTFDGRIKPDISTQGVQVYGARSGTVASYSSSNGTSAACPIASGSAALIWSIYPHITNDQLRKIIQLSCDSASSPNNNTGYGILKVDRAINLPNIELHETGSYILYKGFIYNEKIDHNSIKIYLSTDGINYNEQKIIIENQIYSKIELPLSEYYKKNYFYYTYNDSMGVTYREPEKGFYAIDYGEMHIKKVEKIEDDLIIPVRFILEQNYPNPFNNETTIEFDAVLEEQIEFSVYDILGRRIYRDELFTKVGTNFIKLNNSNINWNVQTSGVYIYVINSATVNSAKKMLFLK